MDRTNPMNQPNGTVISGTCASFGVPAPIADMSPAVSTHLAYWDAKRRPEALSEGASG
jgi:hypothetical protein